MLKVGEAGTLKTMQNVSEGVTESIGECRLKWSDTACSSEPDEKRGRETSGGVLWLKDNPCGMSLYKQVWLIHQLDDEVFFDGLIAVIQVPLYSYSLHKTTPKYYWGEYLLFSLFFLRKDRLTFATPSSKMIFLEYLGTLAGFSRASALETKLVLGFSLKGKTGSRWGQQLLAVGSNVAAPTDLICPTNCGPCSCCWLSGSYRCQFCRLTSYECKNLLVWWFIYTYYASFWIMWNTWVNRIAIVLV